MRPFCFVGGVLLGQIFLSASIENIFRIVPKGQDVTQGRRAILQCSLKEEFRDLYTLSWLCDGEQIENGRRYVGSDGYLYFESIDKDLDSGQFRCVATSNDDSRVKHVTDPVTFNIKWLNVGAVLLRVPSGNIDILPGSRIILKCNATAKPKLQSKSITWRFNDIEMDDIKDPRIHFQVTKGRLLIEKAELAIYDGVYSCCASMGADHKCSSPNYNLRVRDKSVPVIVTPLSDIIVKQSSDARFFCKFDSTPPPQIEWRRDRDLIKVRQNEECRICIFSNGTMLIKNVKERYEGKYTCEATGVNGNKTSSSAMLSVAYIKEFSNPEVEEEYLDLGRDLEKVCDAPRGLPTPNITWMKNGKKIDEHLSRHLTVSGRTLVILSVRQLDEGDYQCVAENMAGSVTKTFRFRIKSAPKLQSKLVGRTEKEGDDVTLKCLVDAVPAPTYTWHHNSVPVPSDGHFIITGNHLTIKGILLKDAAEYKCTARNDLGEVSSSAIIRVEEQLKFDPLPMTTCAEVNQQTEVICGARGTKNPFVSWTVNPPSDKYKIISGPGESNETLVITNPALGDTWTAHCSIGDAHNDIGTKTQHISISVGRRPKIATLPQNSTVFSGQSVRFDCGVDPKIKLRLSKLRWTVLAGNSTKKYTVKNNSDSDAYSIMNNGSFYIKNTSTADSGTYACTYKECGFEVGGRASLDVAARRGPVTDSGNVNDNDDSADTPQYKNIQTVALAVGCSVAYLILTITIIVYCRRKKRHKKFRANNSQEVHDEQGDNGEKVMLNGMSKSGSGHTKENGLLLEPVTHLDDAISDLQYDQSNLDCVTVIGRGEFGEVFLSRAPGLFPELTEDILVMVKKLEEDLSAGDSVTDQDARSTSRRFEFNREIRLLYMAKHENVGRLLAVCSERQNPTSPNHIITEYLEWGILKLCLQASKEGKLQRFSKHAKMKMCCQIAAGLEHLTELGIAHRDVATRNCIISSKLLIKLSVLSLTKEGFEKEYSLHRGRLKPIRWMAPESLYKDRFELKSDVWSFGVACWEIFTLGITPFSDLSDDQFIEEMQSDHSPTLPPLDNSKRITSLISKCCQRNPESRPEFCQIVKKLQAILGAETSSTNSAQNKGHSECAKPLLSRGNDDDEDHDTVTKVKT